VALFLLERAGGDSVTRGLLVIIGLMLLCASVASGAGPMIVAEHGLTFSEPIGLLLLGCGFVLVAYQIRRKC